MGLQWSDTPGAPQEVRYVQEVSEEYAMQRGRDVPSGLEAAVREALEQTYATLWREGMMPVSWSIKFESGRLQLNPHARPTVTLRAMAVRNGQTPEFIVRAAMGLPLEGL